jgi:hypothetical protein
VQGGKGGQERFIESRREKEKSVFKGNWRGRRIHSGAAGEEDICSSRAVAERLSYDESRKGERGRERMTARASLLY